MSGRNRAVLARDAAARLGQATCRGQRDLWNVHERAYLEANNRVSAAAAAEGALLLCGECPAIELCAHWATVDRYTGLAAGTAWLGGRRQKLRQIDPASSEDNTRATPAATPDRGTSTATPHRRKAA